MKMLVWEKLTNGKVEFASDLVCSTITYWFGEQVKEQVREQPNGQVGGQVGGQVSGQVGGQVSGQVQLLLNSIRDKAYSITELQERLRIKSRRYLREEIIIPAIEGGYVLRAYPDKLKHPNQRYYLSEKGLKLVK